MALTRNIVAAVQLALLAGAGAASATTLTDAVRNGNGLALQSVLEAQGVDVNAPGSDGATALHWAVYLDDVAAARLLLEAGADVSATNREGVTPLYLAAQTGDAELIKLLLEAGADPNERFRHGETTLMMAARTGNVAAIDTLIASGAEIDATEELRGTTALMWAAAYSNSAAVKALVDYGADIGARSATTVRGKSPRVAPTARDRIEGYKRDIAEAGESDEDQQADADDDSGRRRRAPPRDWGGLTALVFAAREGDMESARILLEAGADINQVTEYGWTPLLTAVDNRYYRLASYFLENGADPNIQNKGGWSALYLATDNRNIEGGDYPTRKPDMDHLAFIESLLAHGADPNVRMESSTETRTVFTNQWLYEDGATPFLRAAQSGDFALMKLLLEHGADPTLPTYDGVTPLMVASGIGWVDGVTYEWSEEQTFQAVELLLDLGADVNAHDNVDHRTALMGAAHKGRSDVVQLLVDHGADLSARDIGSRDSIHKLFGVTWQAIDYADGLVRVGVQSAVVHPETAALIRKLMKERGLAVPPAGRTLESICITDICKPPL